MTEPTISLIFPAYNEVARIAQTVSEARDYFEARDLTFEIIVAADGDDGTREVVADMAHTDSRLKVTGGVERRGKGYGLRAAIPVATGRYIGFSDADNKTPITEFDKVRPHLENGVEVVIGSRGFADSEIEQRQPWYRHIGSRVFRVYMHVLTGLYDIRDTQCGFKFFQGDVARDLFSRQKIDGYMYDVEILYLARRSGYQILELPIRWRDDNDSRLNLVRGNIENFADVWRIRQLHAESSAVTRSENKTIS